MSKSEVLEGADTETTRATDTSETVEADKADKSSEKTAHSTPTTRLVLVRHAVTPQTGPLLSGRKPGIDLSDEGRAQAKAVGIRLAPPVRIDRIFASPIERTQQTAQALAEHHNLEVVTLDGVIEAEYGDWTGGAIAELARTDLWRVVQTAPSRARFPNGEGIAEMQARMVAALDELITNHAGEHIVVVSHADPIKSAIAHYTGMHLDLFQRVVVSPASVTVFEFSGYGGSLVKLNETGSLSELVKQPKGEDS